MENTTKKPTLQELLTQTKESYSLRKQEITEKYGKHRVMYVPVFDEYEENIQSYTYCILKPMNKQVLGQYMALQQNNPLQAQEVVFRALWLEGDATLLDDVNHFDRFKNALTTMMNSSIMAAAVGELGK